MIEFKLLSKEIEESYKMYNQGNISEAINKIQLLINSYSKSSEKEPLCVCLALKSLFLYNTEPFINVMRELENANFLANSIDYKYGKDIINYVFSLIFYKENDYSSAKRYFNLIKNIEKLFFENKNNLKEKLNNTETIVQKKSPMLALLNIAKTISSKTNIDTLLKTIADETTVALDAERCTVFIIDKEKNELWSKVATGINFEEIRFPINKGLAGHVAVSGETVNIQDAYSDTRFNKEIDNQTGYHTKNILCMPIRNMHYEIIGVLQVLNKKEACFSKYDEESLVTIGMNAGIAIENSRLFEKQQQMLEQQNKLFSSFVDTLVASIDARDKITSGHSTRVKLYSQLICKQMRLNEQETSLILQAAILHDIGKIGIRDSVLQKEGKLTEEEYSHIQEHAKITHEILSKIYNTVDTQQIAEIASSHHEKYNGKGYYRGLKGEEIPLGGRILAVADVFDAITSKRHYRDKMPIKEVLSIIVNDSGSHFDPNVTKNFLEITCDKIIKVFLYEEGKNINKNDKLILSKYNLKNLYEIISNEPFKLEEKQKTLTTIFKKYYTI